MLLTETGLALIEHLERQRDIPPLLDSFHQLMQTFGMTIFCIGDPAHAGAKRANRRWDGTWSAEWEHYYASQDYLSTDPLVAQMKRGAEPFRWSSIYARACPTGRRMMSDAKAFGIMDGLAVPIHGPHGAVAGVAIGSGHYELSPGDERALHMAALYLHAKISVLRASVTPRPARRLTPRERECLQWVAAGKTDWEISQILNISEQTAHGYVQSALTKLDARTRAQAVALAIQSSQILP